MLILISQDGCKAIEFDKIGFFVIPPDKTINNKFSLMAKTPDIDNNFYDYLILFEHENLDVVKNVMCFLANGIFLRSHDDNQNLLVVDLPDLYKHGMKTRDFNNGQKV